MHTPRKVTFADAIILVRWSPGAVLAGPYSRSTRVSPMNILIVSPHFPPTYIGGVEIYARRLADVLLARGDAPVVVAVERVDRGRSDVSVDTDHAFGYPVHRLSGGVVHGRERLVASFRSAASERAVDRILDQAAPDVVHLHSGYLLGGPVLAAARRRRIPIVVTLHDYWFICPRITLTHPAGAPCTGPDSVGKCLWCRATEQRRYRVPDTVLRGRLGRVVVQILDQPGIAQVTRRVPSVSELSLRRSVLLESLHAVDVILSPSQFLREQMIQAGVPGDRIQVSRYGIEIVPQKRRDRAAAGVLRVGFLGQIAPHKGVHHLIAAVRLLPEDRLAVGLFGDLTREPAYVARLHALARGDARITFHGGYAHSRVYEILTDLDAIVVPSVWYENAPFVIQEAQAAGVPVVASRLGGMRELVADEQNGLLFEPGSVTDLARQLRRLLTEPGLLERLRPDPAIVRSAGDEFTELHRLYARLSGRVSATEPRPQRGDTETGAR